LLTSCKWAGTAGDGNIQLEVHSIHFGPNGGSEIVNATKSGFWITELIIYNDDNTLSPIIPESNDQARGEWVIATKVENASGFPSLHIEVLPNNIGKARSASVTVSYMDYSESLKIEQDSMN